MENNGYSNYSFGTIEKSDVVATNKAIAGSFLWMFLGALITLLVGMASTTIAANVLTSPTGSLTYLFIFIGCFIFQIVLTTKLHKNTYIKQNYGKSLLTFFAYSALTGFTFSFLFVFFDAAILNQVFAGVSLYFLLLAGLTFVFRKKIESAAGFAYVGLSVLLIASTIMLLVSLFAFGGAFFNTLYLAISILGILVFTIITMVDIKSAYETLRYDSNRKCMMVYFAFSLYLDFINIFVYVLRILAILGKFSSNRD